MVLGLPRGLPCGGDRPLRVGEPGGVMLLRVGELSCCMPLRRDGNRD